MGAEGTTERVLRLLALLQRRPTWTAADLAAELCVTDRSVRRDVQRLRSLGYPVHAAPGIGGGYRLGAGTRLPPLLLDDAEATATAVALRLASTSTVMGTGEAALGALAKLDQVMPPRLRGQVRELQNATATLAGPQSGVNIEVLVALAHACRESLRVRFQYTAAGGNEQERTVEPVQMVATSRRWYLMAYDLDREDWRTFRLDRLREVTTSTWRFSKRDHPDPVAYVQQSVTAAPYRYVARVRLRATVEQVSARVPPQVGKVEGQDGAWTLYTAGADNLDWLAMHIAHIGFETEILEPSELFDAARRLSARLAGMAVS